MEDPVVGRQKSLTRTELKTLKLWLESCCPVCGVPHENQLHEAVLRLRGFAKSRRASK
jgi:DNA repair exonuclease SbcCD ATPase subunit